MSWVNALSGLWGGIRPHVTNSNNWMGALGALGTGLGVYDMYRARKAESDFLKQHSDWQAQVQRIANRPLRINPDVARRVEELSSAPLDVESFYAPGKDLIQRQIEAGLAARGLQPGGAYMGAVGEGLGAHWLNASQMAQALRNSHIDAAMGRYQGEINSQLGARQAALQGMMGTGPARPNLPPGGDVGALGKYLAHRQTQQTMDQARADQKSFQEQLLERLGSGGQGYAAPTGRDIYVGEYAEDDRYAY